MSEICLDCLNKEFGKKYKASAVILEDDLCEACGEIKPCVIRFRRPWERIKYFFGFRERPFTEEELAEMEAEEEAEFAKLMDTLAQQEGEKYERLNERLQNDPSAAVPPEIEKRALDFIKETTSS